MSARELNRRLSPEDAAFLLMDTDASPQNIGSIAIFEGDIDLERWRGAPGCRDGELRGLADARGCRCSSRIPGARAGHLEERGAAALMPTLLGR